MPVWRVSSRVFAAFSRRHGLNAPSMEFLTGVIPVAEVDRHYTDDRLDIWGANAQQPGTIIANRLGAISLVTQEKEALVHQVDAHIITVLAGVLSVDAHIFTPLQAYDPHVHNPFIGFAWLQPISTGEAGRLPRAFLLEGEQDFLQVVTVNGAPHTTIGPTIRASTSADAPSKVSFWTYQDPPLRLRPFTQLTVQMLVQLRVGDFLNVNFWWSERDDQGRVG